MGYGLDPTVCAHLASFCAVRADACVARPPSERLARLQQSHADDWADAAGEAVWRRSPRGQAYYAEMDRIQADTAPVDCW
eukprot:COSAG04_NODE_31006_length_259_cov_0.650000_1_plen_79_part_01